MDKQNFPDFTCYLVYFHFRTKDMCSSALSYIISESISNIKYINTSSTISEFLKKLQHIFSPNNYGNFQVAFLLPFPT